METIKISHKWFNLPKGTVVIFDGKPVVLQEEAIVFNQGTINALPAENASK